MDCGQLGDGESCESKTWGEDRVPACQSVTKCSEDWSSYEAEGDECYGKGKDDCTGSCSYAFHCYEEWHADAGPAHHGHHGPQPICGSADSRAQCEGSHEFNSSCTWQPYNGSLSEAYDSAADEFQQRCVVYSNIVQVSPESTLKPLDVCTLMSDEDGTFCPDKTDRDFYDHCRRKRSEFPSLVTHADHRPRDCGTKYRWLDEALSLIHI